MEYAAIVLFAGVAAAAVIYPLVSRKRYLYDIEHVFSTGDVRQLNYLNGKKELVLENLKELDFEYEMGKLSEEDYSRLRQGYLAEAEEVVQAIDKLKIQAEIEQLIESDVRERRRTE
jgi:hypothetical protein